MRDGPPKSGKTFNMCRIISEGVSTKRIHKLWVINPTAHANVQYFDALNIEKEYLDDLYDEDKIERFFNKLEQEQKKLLNGKYILEETLGNV